MPKVLAGLKSMGATPAALLAQCVAEKKSLAQFWEDKETAATKALSKL